MIEVEMKLPIDHTEAVQADLEKIGFIKSDLFCEEDVYFDNDSWQIRKNGEALRVRKVTDLLTDQSNAVITYKGKKMDQVSMSRKELETEVGDEKICIQILSALGFHMISPQVRKIRQEYRMDHMTACIDQVQDLGNFLELEIVIAEEENKEDALRQIDEMLHQLGYTLQDTTRNSYLSMLQHVEDD